MLAGWTCGILLACILSIRLRKESKPKVKKMLTNRCWMHFKVLIFCNTLNFIVVQSQEYSKLIVVHNNGAEDRAMTRNLINAQLNTQHYISIWLKPDISINRRSTKRRAAKRLACISLKNGQWKWAFVWNHYVMVNYEEGHTKK